MNHTDSPFPIALCKRPRRRFRMLAGSVLMTALGLVPILGIAQASRQRANLTSVTSATVVAPASRRQIDRPATITLGALIEEQRRARAHRRALAAAELQVAELPPGEAWQAQLGAFSSVDAAERQRGRLIAAGVPVVIERVGSLHRLQSIPAVRAETDGLCARAQAGGIDCFVRQASTTI